ncbi:MAG: DUF309 domain-containing protein [Armatimonadetes bacterium]|nr:DUF309 domain-containing protein [Armatimonadota bacterium]
MNEESRLALRRWAEMFNEQEFFEAHEILEAPWLAAQEPDKTFLKGLIHAAVALYQYRRGNGHGARAKTLSCIRYLSPYRPRYRGVAVADLLGDLQCFMAAHLRQPDGAPPPPPPGPWPGARQEG